ncbi:MAG: hypothetical protein KC535_01250 [Nanoarchaeota archaeon]|nr:hypothetical protein [Nanoarchaeota archaeon]
MDMANIRANPNGTGFICRTCLEAKTGVKSPLAASSSQKEDIFSKKSYLCEDCGYTFERNATFVVADCPMCARTNVHEMMIETSFDLEEEKDWLYE